MADRPDYETGPEEVAHYLCDHCGCSYGSAESAGSCCSEVTPEQDERRRRLAVEAIRQAKVSGCRCSQVAAVLDARSGEVNAFVAQYRHARPGSVARFICEVVDAIDGVGR